MIPALKAEFRKLATVRSTYVIPAIAFGLLIFVAGYIQGYKNGVASTSGELAALAPSFLARALPLHASVLSIFGALVALLLATHEYRYNTIMYSLTSLNRRSKLIMAKVMAVMVYAAMFAVLGTFVAIASMYLGLHASGVILPAQDMTVAVYGLKMLLFIEGWALAGLLIGVVLRNQVAGIAVLFIVPGTLESLLGLLLKENAKYLPFNALSQVLNTNTNVAGFEHPLQPTQALLVFLAYLVGGWIITWILFLKRDAD